MKRYFSVMLFVLLTLAAATVQGFAQTLPVTTTVATAPATDLDKILSFAQWLVTIVLAWLIPSPVQRKQQVQAIQAADATQ
jgi:hypothetical protein